MSDRRSRRSVRARLLLATAVGALYGDPRVDRDPEPPRRECGCAFTDAPTRCDRDFPEPACACWCHDGGSA